MRCSKVLKKLNAFIDNECNKKQRTQIEEHLKTCPECKTAFENIKKTNEFLSNALIIKGSEHLMDKIKNKIESQQKLSFFSRFGIALKQAAFPGIATVLTGLAIYAGVIVGNNVLTTNKATTEISKTLNSNDFLSYLETMPLDDVVESLVVRNIENNGDNNEKQ